MEKAEETQRTQELRWEAWGEGQEPPHMLEGQTTSYISWTFQKQMQWGQKLQTDLARWSCWGYVIYTSSPSGTQPELDWCSHCSNSLGVHETYSVPRNCLMKEEGSLFDRGTAALMYSLNFELAEYLPERNFYIIKDHFGLENNDSPLIVILVFCPHPTPSHMPELCLAGSLVLL